jgi:hypothetical protein
VSILLPDARLITFLAEICWCISGRRSTLWREKMLAIVAADRFAAALLCDQFGTGSDFRP